MPRGRPALKVEDHIERLAEAILLGATYKLAAQYAGISYKTFEGWCQRAEHAAPGTPLARLRERLAEAEALAALGWLAKIERAADEGDWRAAAWKLERRYPEAWGRVARHDVRVSVEHMVARVAQELGIDTAVLLAEAQLLLTEGDHARPA